MPTQKQIEANRSNARHSTGPRTEAGLEKSSRNSLSHGLSASQNIFLEGEDPTLFQDLVEKLRNDVRPVGAIEEELVMQAAQTFWRLRRIPVIEASLFAWISARQQQCENQESADLDELLGTLPPQALVFRKKSLSADQKQRFRVGSVIEDLLTNNLTEKLDRHGDQLWRKLTRTLDQLRTAQDGRTRLEPLPSAVPRSP